MEGYVGSWQIWLANCILDACVLELWLVICFRDPSCLGSLTWDVLPRMSGGICGCNACQYPVWSRGQTFHETRESSLATKTKIPSPRRQLLLSFSTGFRREAMRSASGSLPGSRAVTHSPRRGLDEAQACFLLRRIIPELCVLPKIIRCSVGQLPPPDPNKAANKAATWPSLR